MGRAAVFLDRDDTLIENVPYLGDPKKVVLLPGAQEAMATLHQASFPLLVVSNQSGVGRGLISKEQVAAVDSRMIELLGIPKIFSGFFHCYAAPTDPYDDRRKPSPRMLQEAAVLHHLDLGRSFMVGNRPSDIQAGKTAGCQTVFLTLRIDPEEKEEATQLATFTAKDWASAAQWILQQKGGG